MPKPNFNSMVKEAERQMTRGMGMRSMMGNSMPMMKRKKGKGGRSRIKGYADPFD